MSEQTFVGDMGSVLDLGGTLAACNDLPDPALADWLTLKQDWTAVGDDLRAALAKALGSMEPAEGEQLAQSLRRNSRTSLYR